MMLQQIDRRSVARLRFREDRGLVLRIQHMSAQMKSLTSPQLQHYVEQLRDSVLGGMAITAPDVLEAGFALVNEGLRRTFGHNFYEVQLLAGLILTRGGIAEMATGEGKTLTAALPAFMHALKGLGVHVASANAYLAERDQALLAPLFELLGMSCGHAKDQASPDVKRRAYDCDITYATGHEFGFDYLRDQVALRQQTGKRLGQGFLSRFHQAYAGRIRMQRGLAFAIIDEADNILIDDAVSPLLLSAATAETAPDAQLYQHAIQMAQSLDEGVHYRLDRATRDLRMLQPGLDLAHARLDKLPVELLQRPWAQYVEQGLKAIHLMHRDVNYVLVEDEVRIVDESTGRIFTDRSWSDGLHQAVEAKEGVNVTCEKQALARITRQRFYQLYAGLCGMTGTATGSEREFRDVYRTDVAAVPLRCPSQRRILPTRYFQSQQRKWEAIAEEIQQRHSHGQPVLIGTRSIADSVVLADLLTIRKLPFNLLNGRQDRDEAELVAEAGHHGAVTIATNLAGRGTDIKLDTKAIESGGLHVIASERHSSSRVDRQLVGRCARQGDPGSAQFFVSADDDIPAREAPSVATGIRRLSMKHDCPGQFDRAISQIQKRVESRHEQQRKAMLRTDFERDSVIAKFQGEIR